MAGPGGEDRAFSPEDGAGGCHQEGWAHGVAHGPQNIVSLQDNLSGPPCATRGGEPGFPAVCVHTDLE